VDACGDKDEKVGLGLRIRIHIRQLCGVKGWGVGIR
jgi:hypothetical protein